MILRPKNPYLRIAQTNELRTVIDIAEGAVSQLRYPAVKIHPVPRRRGASQRRCGHRMLFGMDVQVDIARRPQPALRVVASHRPPFSQNRINTRSSKGPKHFFDLTIVNLCVQGLKAVGLVKRMR